MWESAVHWTSCKFRPKWNSLMLKFEITIMIGLVQRHIKRITICSLDWLVFLIMVVVNRLINMVYHWLNYVVDTHLLVLFLSFGIGFCVTVYSGPLSDIWNWCCKCCFSVFLSQFIKNIFRFWNSLVQMGVVQTR